MSYVQGVSGGVEADVEGRLAFVYHLLDLFLVGYLRDESACY